MTDNTSSMLLVIGLGLQLVGLVIEGVSLLSFGPGAFITFAGVGLPMIFGGVFLYCVYVVRQLTKRGAL